jgi:hypothetical protein
MIMMTTRPSTTHRQQPAAPFSHLVRCHGRGSNNTIPCAALRPALSSALVPELVVTGPPPVFVLSLIAKSPCSLGVSAASPTPLPRASEARASHVWPSCLLPHGQKTQTQTQTIEKIEKSRRRPRRDGGEVRRLNGHQENTPSSVASPLERRVSAMWSSSPPPPPSRRSLRAVRRRLLQGPWDLLPAGKKGRTCQVIRPQERSEQDDLPQEA